MNWFMRRCYETGAGGSGGGAAGDGQAGGQQGGQKEGQPSPAFTQEQVDAIIKERLAREGVKREELDELRKFKTEHEKMLQQQQQVDLEKQQKYEEIKKTWDGEKTTLQQQIAEKEQAIQSMSIDNALTLAVMQHNLYPEAKDLIKTSAVINDEGQVMIKTKVNNIDTLVSVEDGVKAFAEAKPYLQKAPAGTGRGSGTPPAGQGGGQGSDGGKPLAQQLQEARAVGDHKKVSEIKQQIRQNWAAQGINAQL